MDISINNLGGNSSPSVSSLISQLVSKRTQSLNSLLDQKSQIENSLAALQSGALGIGSINNSYSEQIASLQDTIDKLNEQYSINANKITTINSLKKSYSSTVSSLEKYIESLKNPNSANTDLDIYLDGNKVSSNNKVDVTINDKNTNVQEITLNVTQIATTSTLKSNVLLGGTATANTKITDLFAGIFDAANNSIKTNRQDLKESLRLRDLGVTSGSFNLGSAKITIDAENDTIGDLIQKIKDAGYNAQIETTSYDDNGEAVGRLLISGSDGKSVSITNQTSNFTSLMGLTVSEGNFYINGAEFTITADSTLGSLMKEINSASADNVGAKLEDGKLVFVASETGAVDINVEKGTSNFTNAIGFTVGGVMNQSNLVLGTDGSYVTLTGQNTSVSLTDSVAGGKFTEGNFNIFYNEVDEHGKVSDELTKVTIEVTADDTVESIIEKIKNQTAGSYVDEEGNTIQTGLTAEVVNGQFVIRQVQKGAEFDISIEAGSSNFTNYVGMTTQVSNTTSKDAENSYILGTTVVPNSGFTEGSFIISTNKLSDDGKTALFETISAVIEVTSTDTAQTIADKITNAGLDLTASITEDGHFKIEQNNSGVDFDITVTAGGTDFTEKAGLTSNIINTGVLSPGSDVNQFTTLTGANSVTGSTAVGKGTFKINGVTVEIGAGTINSAIEDINSYSNQTGVNAYLKDGKVVLQANKTGADYSIYVEGGTSNFGSIAGFVSESQSAATAVIGQTGSKTTLTGAYDVTKDMQVSAGTININGLNINIEAGTLENVIGQINKYSDETGVTASIKNGKFVLTNTENGDMSINVVDGSSNLAELTGITAYQTEVGREEILGATQTTMTASKTGLQKSNGISDSQIQINGQTINLSQDIGHAIDQINAYTNMTGVEAYLDTQGRFVLRNVKAGSHTINFKDISGDFTRVIGAASSSTSAGSSGQTGTKGAVMTGGMDGLTENTAIMGGGTLNIGGTAVSLDGLKNIGEVIDKINSSGAKATASLNEYGQFVIAGNETGKNIDVSYSGNGNFGYVTGFGSYNIGSDPTNNGTITGNNNVTEIGSSSSIPSQPSEPVYEYTATVLQGNRTVSSTWQLGSNTVIKLGSSASDAVTITAQAADTIGDFISSINALTSQTGIEASISGGKFTLTRVTDVTDDIYIDVTEGSFGVVTGLDSYTASSPVISNPDVEDKIFGIIAEQLGVSESSISYDDTIESLGGDSLDAFELFMAVEEEFGVEIPDNTAAGFANVGELTNYIASETGADTGNTAYRSNFTVVELNNMIRSGALSGTLSFGVTPSASNWSVAITSSMTAQTLVDQLNARVSSLLGDMQFTISDDGYILSPVKLRGDNKLYFGGDNDIQVALGVESGTISSDMTKTMGTMNVVSSGSAGSSSSVRLTEEEAVAQGYTVIKTAAQLNNIRNDLDGKYILMGDIDLSGVNWTAIGSMDAAFTGIFNGNGYTISNLKVDSDEGAGLFGVTDGALLQNINIKNANVDALYAGILVGYMIDSTIVSVSTSGNVYSSVFAGGIVGLIDGKSSITESSADVVVDINSDTYSGAGGLIGAISQGSNFYISDSYATGKIDGSLPLGAGGLIGSDIMSDSLEIANSYASVDISNVTSAAGDYVNGFIGYFSGDNLTISNSFWNKDNAQHAVYGQDNNGLFVPTGLKGVSGSSISSSAQSAGWDESIWDFSGSMPVLKSQMGDSSSAESQVSEGSIIINDKVINISEGTIYDAVNTINAALSETGVIALINDYGQLVLKNSDGGTDNITLGAGTSNLWEVVGIDPAEHQGLLDYTEGGYSSLQGGRDVTGAQFGEDGSITIKKGSDSVTIDISAGDTAQDVVEKINAADAGLKASLVESGGKLKFKIESTTEGTDAVSVTVNSGDFGRVTGMTTYSSPGATTIGGDAGDKVVGGVGSISGDESGFSGGSFTITLGHDEADSNGGLVIGTSDVTDVGILTEEEALAQGYTIIKTATDLSNIRNYLDGKYILMGDIDLSSYPNWTAIGSSTAFTGELNGNGYTIKNLNINSSSACQGLFGYIAGGKISNLNLSNVNVKSTSSNVGALAGTAAGATISNVHVLSGSVTGSSNVGGLVGVGGLLLGSTIIQSSSAASVTSTSTTTANVGGLVGTATSRDMIIKDSYATGSVTSKSTGSDANDYAGGLIGYISGSDGIIENSYATGTITTANNKKGGIVGYMSEGTLKNNYYKYGIASSSYGYNDSGTNTGNASFSVVLDSSWINKGFSEDIWDFSGTGVPTLISQKPKDAEVTSGSIYINNTSISLSAGSINDAIDAINAKSSTTGVIASINSDGNVVFENKDGSSDNIALRVTATGSNFFSVAGIAVDNKGILNGGNNVKFELTHMSESEAISKGYTVIKTAADLNNIRNNLSGKYILMGDIDLSPYSNWTAIKSFFGELNGNGYTIKNLKINSSSDSQGLFASADGATFSNLYLSNVNVTSSGRWVGALAGNVRFDTTITNVHILSGSVTGSDWVGGLVGSATKSDITQSSSAASVTSTSTGKYSVAGGLVGELSSSSSVSDSYATGSVTSKSTGTGAQSYAGGLVGFIDNSSIENSYATGTITTANNNKGAILGYLNSGTVKNNYYKSGIASSAVGSYYKGTITNNSSFSSVTDSTWISRGFSEDIWDFSGTGAPTLKKPDTTYTTYKQVSAGTIVINGVTINLTAGTMDDIVDQINAKSSSTGVAALINSSSKVELSNKNGSLNSISLTEGTSNFFDVAGFAAEKPSSIQLTEEEALAQGYTIIKTAADLNNIRYDLDGKYILMGDIDLDGSSMIDGDSPFERWTAIGTSSAAFTGELNGNGYTIDGLNISRSADCQGLFARTDGATISNLNLSKVNVRNTSIQTGALIGLADNTTITNVHVLSGSVTGGYYVGGLVGYTIGADISKSSSAANVTSTSTTNSYTGGLVGYLEDTTLTNSYATGSVTSKNTSTSIYAGNYTGGLVGYMYGPSSLIENSYFAGTITASNGKKGSIVGYMDSGTVKNNYYKSGISASTVGRYYEGTIINNYSFSSVTDSTWISKGFSEDIWDFSGSGAPTLKPALKPATETVTISITDSDTVDDVLQKLRDKGLDAEIVDGHVVINGYTSVESISGTSDFGKYVGLQSGSISSDVSSSSGTDGFYTYTGHAVEGLTDVETLGKPIGGLTAGTIYVNGKTVNVSETDSIQTVMSNIISKLTGDGTFIDWGYGADNAIWIKTNAPLELESGTSNFLELVGLTQDGFSSETDIDIEDASVGFNRVTGSESGFELNDSIGALEDGTLTISQDSSSLTIDVSKYDTIQSLIDKINTSNDFEAGLDSQGRFYIQSKNESTTKISIDTAGSTNLDELLGLSGGSFSGSMSQDVGSDGYIKITGSVDLGTSSSAGKVTIPDKFAGRKTFTITGNTGASFTVNISNDMTISTLISKINASGKFTAGIDSDGYFYIQGKEGITDITFSGTSGLEDYLGLSDKSENISSGASQSTGKFDKYSTLTGTAVVNHNMTFSAGNFTLTVGSKSVEINVLDGESITSVINKINNSGLGVTASIQNDKFVITADNPGNISMSLKDGTSNFAELTGFISQGGSQIVSQDKGVLSTYTSANTAQSAQNAGISAGDFYVHLTDMNGNITDTAKITIGKNENIASIIEKINNCGLGVTASINDSGKMVITRNSSDTAGGVLVTKGSSDFTNKIGFTSGGYQAPSTIYGSQAVLTSVNPISTSQKFSNGDFIIVVEDNGIVNETSIDVFESDSIYDIIDRINNADIGVTASLNANNRLVITKDADTSDGSIGIKKGSSDFTTIFGFSSGGVFNGSHETGEAATHTVLVSNKLAVSGKATMASLGVTDGAFRINGVEIAIKSTDTIDDVIGRINSVFNSAVYDYTGVTAEYKNNQIVLTSKKASSNARIEIESGSTNFTEVVGFTNMGSRDNVVDMGQNAQFNIKIGDDEVGTDYDLALDLKDITNDNIYNGNNLIYLNTDGKVVEHANNAAITIEIKETGETIIRIGQNVLDASINELNKFVGNFNKAMIASENEILSDDAEFAALINNIKAALTDDVADLRKIQQQMAEIGITVDIRGGTNSNMGTVRLYLDREKYTQAFYDDSQHVMDLLIGKETAVGVEDGVLTRLNNVLYPEVNNKNGYFNKVPRTLQAVQKELNREITRTTFQLNELKLAVSGQTGVGDGLAEYLAKLEEQYNFVNEAISNLNKQYASSVTRLILNQNNAGFNPIVT